MEFQGKRIEQIGKYALEYRSWYDLPWCVVTASTGSLIKNFWDEKSARKFLKKIG